MGNHRSEFFAGGNTCRDALEAGRQGWPLHSSGTLSKTSGLQGRHLAAGGQTHPVGAIKKSHGDFIATKATAQVQIGGPGNYVAI